MLIIISIILKGCGGTHGNIETFSFNRPKNIVEQIIMEMSEKKVIEFVPNDRTNYQEVTLKNASSFQTFTYRFYGDSSTFWEDDKNKSAIMLIYVKRENKYESEEKLNSNLKRKAIEEFDRNFISLINARLKENNN